MDKINKHFADFDTKSLDLNTLLHLNHLNLDVITKAPIVGLVTFLTCAYTCS